MPKFYLVKDVGPGFDGVLVEGEPIMEQVVPGFSEDSPPVSTGLVSILRFIDTDSILGDRNSSSPVTPGSMLMDEAFLTEVEDPKLRQFDSKSPFGRFELEGRMSCGNIEVTYAQYEKALTVAVMEVTKRDDLGVPDMKTLYSENFTDPATFQALKLVIEHHLRDEESSEDLIFVLKQNKELNG